MYSRDDFVGCKAAGGLFTRIMSEGRPQAPEP
jgi:hypothetical protein